MSDLKQLRLRIKSIKSTRKITKAMQMVSASRLKRAREALESANYYYSAVAKAASQVIASDGEMSDFTKRILSGDFDPTKPKLVIVFGGDRGLCGSFNHSMLKKVKEEICSSEDFFVIAVGKRMMDFVENYCPESILEEHFASCINDEVISDIASLIVKRITEGSISSVHIFYNQFHNVIMQEAIDKTIIPVAIPEDKDTGPSPFLEGEGILDKLLKLYIIAELKNANVHSHASEEAARTTAMDNATKNAGDLIDRLTLVMNRKRQAVITKELIEIISGAEAV